MKQSREHYISPVNMCPMLACDVNEKRYFAGMQGYAVVTYENSEFHVVLNDEDPAFDDVMTDYYISPDDAAYTLELQTNAKNRYLGIDEEIKVTFENGMFHVVMNSETHD